MRHVLASCSAFSIATRTPGRTGLRLLVVLLLPLAPLAAQRTAPPDLRVSSSHDTGVVANSGRRTDVIAAFTASAPGAQSLRLYFDSVELSGDVGAGTGSFLRITSLQDGALQTLDSQRCREWQNSTAYFNGSIVLVEIVAQPGTGGNRVVLGSVDAGQEWSGAKSQCGPMDDRVPSSDPRIARLLPIGCTGWMINDCGHCFLTAGHCSGGIGVVQFNVPPFTASGALQNPPPKDQYSMDPASMQTNGGQGVGNDYAYFGCFPNANTGMTPFQAQGLGFALVSPPPVAGNTIRITGFGTDATPLTANQTQQTSVGPFTGNPGTTVLYQTDSEGGNSGSPVIWEQTGKAIGIHTNGGCSTGGSGSNSGTSIDLGALQFALAHPTGSCVGSCGAFTNLGGGLAGVQGVPLLVGSGALLPNSAVTLTLSQADFFAPATLVVGLSALQAPFKGGVMVPRPDILISGLMTAFGFETFPFTWPAGVPSGFQTWYQFWMPDSAGVQGFSASNAILATAP